MTLAVVDKKPEGTVIWHVQTDHIATGILTGAWIATDEQAATLLDGTTVVNLDGTGDTTLEGIRAALEADVATLKAAAKRAKAANSSLVVPRFDALPDTDPAELADGFHGEDIARDAWTYATALAELVEYFQQIESQRKSRKYLVEEFGEDTRPMPLGL